MSDQVTTPSLSRRRLLGSAGAVGLGLVIAACGSDTKDAALSNSTGTGGTTPGSATTLATPGTSGATTAGTTAPTDGGSVDLKVAKLAASLEVLAVGTYKAALDAATAGKLGTVPAAVGEFVTTAMSQHQAHLDAWNKVLTGAGETAVTEPNATLKPTVDAAFGKVTDVTGATMLALQLEEIAAATYNNAQSVLTDKDAIKLAGSIQIIDAQHAAILHFVLGDYPVPDVFAKVDMAAAA
ncbi:MAG: ferritin-like domain-containing protein [Ilumatobacteraceae bacterium]